MSLYISSKYEKKSLDEIAEIILGQSPPSSTYNKTGDGLPFFQGKSEFTAVHPIVRQYTSAATKVANEGDILLSVRAPIGPTNIANQTAAIGRGLAAIRYPENYKYILYYFKLIEKSLDDLGTGTTFRAITGPKLKSLEIPFAPKDIQVSIVNKIEELFSELDEASRGIAANKQLLDVYRNAVLKRAFDGLLDLSSKGSWHTYKLKEILKTVDGDRGPNYPKKSDYSNKGFCLFLSTKNVRKYGFKFDDLVFITKEKHEALRNGTLQRGDIIITTRGTLGNVAIFDETVPYEVVRINSGMLILRMLTEEVDRQFLVNFLFSPQFNFQLEKMRSGTAQPQIPANVLKEIEINIPPVKVQREVNEYIDEKMSVIDNIHSIMNYTGAAISGLRQSILSKAYKGDLL